MTREKSTERSGQARRVRLKCRGDEKLPEGLKDLTFDGIARKTTEAERSNDRRQE